MLMILCPFDFYLDAILVLLNFKLPELIPVRYLKSTLKPPSSTSLKLAFLSLTSPSSVLFGITLEKYVKFSLSLRPPTSLTPLPVTPCRSPLSIMVLNLHFPSFNLYSTPSLALPPTILLKLRKSTFNDFKKPLTPSLPGFPGSLPINNMAVPSPMKLSPLLHPPFLEILNVPQSFSSPPPPSGFYIIIAPFEHNIPHSLPDLFLTPNF